MMVACCITSSTIRPWWRHQMETFSALIALCAGPGEFPTQRPVTRSFVVFFDLRLNKRLSKQPWSRWFETPLLSLWRQYSAIIHGYEGCVRLMNDWLRELMTFSIKLPNPFIFKLFMVFIEMAKAFRMHLYYRHSCNGYCKWASFNLIFIYRHIDSKRFASLYC